MNNLLNFKNLLLITYILDSTIINAQLSDTLEAERDNTTGKIIYAKIPGSFSDQYTAEKDVALLKKVLKVKAGNEFLMTKSMTDSLGIIHHRYQQYYKGIKIEGAEYLTHSSNGIITTINGYFADVDVTTLLPKIDSFAALNIALQTVKAKKYAWTHVSDMLYPKAELVIANNAMKDGNWKLSWKFTIIAKEPFSAEDIFIDAKSGTVINRYSVICNGNASGTAATRYSGTKAITGDSFTGGYRLREVLSGVNLGTLNYNHGNDPLDPSGATDFKDNDNNWTAQEWNNVAKDNAALDAHWAIENGLNFWRTVFNRNSVDGNGIRIFNYIHFSSGYDNALWNPLAVAIFYGDGGGPTNLKPAVSLDICNHELAHGLAQFTAGLLTNGEAWQLGKD